MKQFADQVRIRLIWQLIKDVSRVLQKLRKHFKGKTVVTFIITSLLVLSINLDLNLNVSEFYKIFRLISAKLV